MNDGNYYLVNFEKYKEVQILNLNEEVFYEICELNNSFINKSKVFFNIDKNNDDLNLNLNEDLKKYFELIEKNCVIALSLFLFIEKYLPRIDKCFVEKLFINNKLTAKILCDILKIFID